MNKIEFLEFLHNGENSKVEFKNVNVSTGKLAKEVVSFLNHEGGYISWEWKMIVIFPVLLPTRI